MAAARLTALLFFFPWEEKRGRDTRCMVVDLFDVCMHRRMSILRSRATERPSAVEKQTSDDLVPWTLGYGAGPQLPSLHTSRQQYWLLGVH
jgi:hypothetical protein